MTLETFADLLIEIGTEELPPTALPTLSRSFAEGIEAQLTAQGIAFTDLERFAAPRRLAVLVRGVLTRQPDQETVRRGPAVQAAFNADGAPTQAALGFARSCGVEVTDLAREETDKGAWLVHRSLRSGQETAGLIPAMVESALAGLPIPKRMRWGDRDAEFVRPVHWVCILLGATRVPGTVLGIETCRSTRGHRFHHPDSIDIAAAADYAERLRGGGYVEPSFERRRELIREQVAALAAEQGLRARIDPALLDEVTALVEWPQPVLCHFDPAYLDIPSEVLIETMERNQRYFALEDADGVLQSAFIAVANLVSRDVDQVRRGNERVIRPRFADAAFFWSKDLEQPLAAFAERLQTVVYQDKLGTLADKGARLARLGRHLAPALGVTPELIERAALLAKCDLVSSMVFEFPALQGTMGRYYAQRSGEDPCVCAAMEEQYLPRFAGDTLPLSGCGRALALADRLDSLVGIFGLGRIPTGAKDPYGLRRASIAVLRLLIETPLDLDLRDLLHAAADGFAPGLLAADTQVTLLAYMLERLRGYYADRGIGGDSVDAVLQTGVTNPWDIDRRISAVAAFRTMPEAESLAAANKRIRNILAKAETSDLGDGAVAADLLTDPAEIRLAHQVATLTAAIAPLAAVSDYVSILTTLAQLREDVDAFFTDVMVMAEDPALRANRIRLLDRVATLFLEVADISRLQTA